MTKADPTLKRRLVRYGYIPQSVGAGRALCHNHVQHDVDTYCGCNGFRARKSKTAEIPKGFIKCPCGYAGLPHYADRDHVKYQRKQFAGR
jgi:hypothetical protein